MCGRQNVTGIKVRTLSKGECVRREGHQGADGNSQHCQWKVRQKVLVSAYRCKASWLGSHAGWRALRGLVLPTPVCWLTARIPSWAGVVARARGVASLLRRGAAYCSVAPPGHAGLAEPAGVPGATAAEYETAAEEEEKHEHDGACNMRMSGAEVLQDAL